MSDKTIKYLIIALVALLCVYGIFRLVDFMGTRKKAPSGFELNDLTSKNVDKIKVKNVDGEYNIEKNNNKWQVDGKDVDDSALSKLWEDLKNASIGEIASTKKDKQALFEIDDKKGAQVTFYQSGKEKGKYIFGKQNVNSCYIRKTGENTVYVIKGSFGELFRRKPEEWKKKKEDNKSQETNQNVPLEKQM